MAKTLGPSDTDAGQRRAKKPVRPKAVPPKAVPPKAVPPKAVKPARPVKPVPAKPKAVAPKAVKPAAPKPAAAKPVAAKPVRPKKPNRPAKPKRPAKPSRPAKPGRPAPQDAEPRSKVADLPQDDPLIGQTIGRCKIEALIGMGKTSLVYRAHYEALDDVVAVKVLRNEIAKNPILVERFESEARAIAKVDNENVLKIYDVGHERGLYYMVVELLLGEEIYEVILREEQVDVMDSLRIIRQAANGLSAAHAQDIVHRDVKPQNLFLLEDGTVKVVDFGLATGFDDTTERVGTPHYMAPEVCEHGNAEFASDIYGLGITLYHLLVGNPPYSGKDIQGILRAHMDGRPLRPRQQRPGLPKEVSEILRHLTKRDPLMRPTAAEVVVELDEFGGKELKERETLKRRVRTGRARAAVARRGRAGRKSVAPILGGIAVIVVAVLIFALKGDDDSLPAPDPNEYTRDGNDPGNVEVGVEKTETPEEKQKREERVFLAEKEKEAKVAFAEAESYARRIWREPKDTAAVLSKYISVINRFKGTGAAVMAKTRVDAIKLKEVHPHPDRELTTASRLEAVKEEWKANGPKILALIEAFDYVGARGLVPPPVSDETGRFQKEIDFWRDHTQHLVDFRKELVSAVRKMPLEDRLIETPEGEATISRITEQEFEVTVGRSKHKFSWPKIGAQAIADLGIEALSADEEPRLMLLQLAFTFAHKLKDGFWDAKMTLETMPGAGIWSRQSKEYKARFK